MDEPFRWYRKAFRRVVIDTHLSAWDETFLSEFDAHNYVEMLKLAHAQSAVVTAHSCVGYFSYPTKVGEIHPCLKGRDMFGEILDLCHANDIKVVAICVLIFDRWAYDHHPDTRRRRTCPGRIGASSWRMEMKSVSIWGLAWSRIPGLGCAARMLQVIEIISRQWLLRSLPYMM